VNPSEQLHGEQEIGRLEMLAGDPAAFASYRKAIRSGCDAGALTRGDTCAPGFFILVGLLSGVSQKCYTRSWRSVMPTKNPRINVALEKPIYSLIARMAQEKGLSLSMVTRDLVREALEIHEDAVLVRVADERVAALAGRRTLTHAEVWE
jgi:hypothetical protein